MGSTGHAERVVVVYRGAQNESASSLPREALFAVLDAPGIRRGTDGKPLASADVLASLWLPRRDRAGQASVAIRGVATGALAARPEIELTAGRLFEPGLREIIVGKGAQARFADMAPGDRVVSGDTEWTVVGTFRSRGDAHESELITDAEALLAALHRTTFNSVTAWLDDPASFETLQAALTADPTLTVDVHRETDFYTRQSNGFGTFLAVVAQVIAAIMAVGAVFGALNTMYAAVSARTVEIATLRAIGFGAAGVVVSVFIESLLLALLGALSGSALAWLFFNGHTVGTISGSSNAQVVFDLHIGADLVLTGIAWACVLGMAGALFPAIRAARLPVAVALRGA
jgi:putative ABC transport system permease protein